MLGKQSQVGRQGYHPRIGERGRLCAGMTGWVAGDGDLRFLDSAALRSE